MKIHELFQLGRVLMLYASKQALYNLDILKNCSVINMFQLTTYTVHVIHE